MKTQRLTSLLAFLAAAAFTGPASAQVPPENLMPEGAMVGDLGSAPRGWNSPHPNYLNRIGARIALEQDTEDAGNFVSISSSDEKQIIRLQTQLEVNPDWIGRTFTVRARLRGTNIQPGSESWHGGGIRYYYTRTDDTIAHGGGGRLVIEVPTPQWRRITHRWVLPADAKIIHLDVGLFGASGTLHARDVEFILE